jgi:hypothetical protein
MKIDLILNTVVFDTEQIFLWDGTVHTCRPDVKVWRGLALHVVARMPGKFIKDRDLVLLPQNKTPTELMAETSRLYRAMLGVKK